MAAELFWTFGRNEGKNNKIKKTSIIQGILKWRKSLKQKSDNGKDWMSNCTIGLQYLVHVGGKCIRSVFRYLSQSTAIKQYQYHIFSWSIKIWAPIFVHPKAVTDLKNGLTSWLLAKTNLDRIKDLISSSLIDSYIERDYFHLIDVLRKYGYMKEEINKLETSEVNYNF